MELSAVILAGGESSRMGRDKAWVEFGGKPLIQLAVEKIRELGAAEIFISGRAGKDYSSLKCPVLFDLDPGLGPVSGIERGLHECASPLLLVLAVDLPRMTTEFLRKLTRRCDRSTGVVPALDGQLEPLAAIYPKRCHAFASETMAGQRRAAREFASSCLRERAVRSWAVDGADADCFRNWNSVADVARSE